MEASTDLTADVELDVPPQRIDLHDPAARTAVEEAVASVPDVVGARLVPGFDRQVDELHVLTTLDKHPKQAVRDVQTVLMARFGIPTDHRVVSVVQLDEGSGLPNTSRVVIDRVALEQRGINTSVEVILRSGEDVHEGASTAAGSTNGRRRAVAQATLDAIRSLLPEECVAELEGVEAAAVGGHQVMVSLVNVTTPRGELTLSGSAPLRDTEPDATVRATLDALNRTIVDDR